MSAEVRLGCRGETERTLVLLEGDQFVVADDPVRIVSVPFENEIVRRIPIGDPAP